MYYNLVSQGYYSVVSVSLVNLMMIPATTSLTGSVFRNQTLNVSYFATILSFLLSFLFIEYWRHFLEEIRSY